MITRLANGFDVWWNKAKKIVSLVLAPILLILFMWTRQEETYKIHVNAMNDILKSTQYTNNLKIKTITVPFVRSIPGVDFLVDNGFMSGEYKGYFTVSNKYDNKSSRCEANTFDYTARQVGSDKFTMKIGKGDVEELADCN
ncbi:hypothetical protein [Methylobacterium sp. Gmos1]